MGVYFQSFLPVNSQITTIQIEE